MQTDLSFGSHELWLPEAVRAGGTPTVEDARAVLARHWGYPDFRGGQADVVRTVLQGRDVLGVLPTGAGKSAIYQTVACLLRGTTVVISPLISLMRDQVQSLRDRGIPAAFINSSMSAADAAAATLALEAGELTLCYIAPERWDSAEFRARIARVHVPLLVVDEAHCVSEWGHDFRTAYTRLGTVREALGAPVLALTATATPEVREDIVRVIGMEDPEVIVRGFDRPNLFWDVAFTRSGADKDRILETRLRGAPPGSHIVYAPTQAATEGLAAWLTTRGIPAAPYHAGITTKERTRIQDAFKEGKTSVLVATSAFGMGVDVPGVRTVVHYAFPGTLESYYQEAGRAGRDGDPSHCLLLFDPADRAIHSARIAELYPDRRLVEATYRALERDADDEGRISGPVAEWARRSGVATERMVSSAVRMLATNGVVQHVARGREGVFVRLRCERSEIRDRLGTEQGAPRLALRALWERFGEHTLQKGVMLRGDDLALLGDKRPKIRTVLAALEDADVLSAEWEEAGCRILQRGLAPGRLPIDWPSAETRHRRALARLQAIEDYALTRGCRREYLLAYFGETSGPACGRCSRCDRYAQAA